MSFNPLIPSEPSYLPYLPPPTFQCSCLQSVCSYHSFHFIYSLWVISSISSTNLLKSVAKKDVALKMESIIK